MTRIHLTLLFCISPLVAQTPPPPPQPLWQIERAAILASNTLQTLTAELYLAQLKLRQAEKEATEAMDKWNACSQYQGMRRGTDGEVRVQAEATG